MNASRQTVARPPGSPEPLEGARPKTAEAGRPPELDDPPGSERVVLIEFRWRGTLGVQPVLYLDRHLLH